MKLTKIYCGSNNETGILEMDIILEVLNRRISSYTIIKAKGRYNGKSEDTAIIEIYGNYNLGIVPSLQQELKQEHILVVEFIVNTNIKDND